MRKLSALLIILAPAALMGGCEDAGHDAKMEARAFTVASQKLASVNAQAFSKTDPASFRQVAQQQYLEIAGELEKLKNKGTKAQQVSARLLLADAYASRARYLSRAARAQWSQLAAQNANVVSQLSIVNSADSQSRAYAPSRAPIITAMEQNKVAQQGRLKAAEAEVVELTGQIDALNGQIDSLDADKAKLADEAQALRQQAFTTKDSKKAYELSVAAIEKDRQANAVATKILDLRDGEAALLTARLEIAQKQAQLAQEVIDAIDEQIGVAQTRDDGDRGHADAALANRKTAEGRLVALYNQMTSDYAEGVDNPLNEAADYFDKAVVELQDAATRADSQQKQSIHATLLGVQVEQAHLLSEHVAMAGANSQLAAILQEHARNVMLADRVDLFGAAAADNAAKQEALANKARGVIAAARSTRTQITHEDYAPGASAQIKQIDAADARIDAALSGESSAPDAAAQPGDAPGADGPLPGLLEDAAATEDDPVADDAPAEEPEK